jgi:radical SAM protein with 4Fe4S-binding SPASM domain
MRCDINRVILTETGTKEHHRMGLDNFTTFIHPIHAMMLTFFKGDKNLDELLLEIGHFFDISRDATLQLVSKFIDNNQKIAVEYDNNIFYFPPKVLIEYNTNYPLRTYTIDEFNIMCKLDFTSNRFNIPIDTNLLINNRCVTDCIYCYADKRQIHNCSIPFNRLVEIIAETKQLGFRNFDIQGGELFLYEYWYELLKELLKANYTVGLSTKFPLQKNQIKKLKGLGFREIQISLDSIFSEDLKKNLRVKGNYKERMIECINVLNDNDFAIKLKPVITAKIFSINKIEKYIDFFLSYKNIKTIEFTAPAHSNYKSQKEFIKYRLSLDQLKKIKELVLRRRDSCHFELLADVAVTGSNENLSFDEKRENWESRTRCPGNLSSFLILPNGDVTICEEAYFNENLILGNILNNTIMEVWNSNRAKSLFYIPKTIFPNESPCSRCVEFDACRYNLGVCWLDAMAAYGEENWLFPVPNCPYAPPPKYITYCE